MKEIKILVPVPVLPYQQNLRVKYVNSFLVPLRKKINTKVIWLIYQPDLVQTFDELDYSICDIHEFPNAKILLEKVNPDLVMVNTGREPINYSISLASKNLGIPVISFSGSIQPITEINNTKSYSSVGEGIRQLFSDQMPTDTKEQKQFFRRARFSNYKYNFLNNTQKALGIGYLQRKNFTIKDRLNHLTRKPLPKNNFVDLNLVHHESIIKTFLEDGFRKEQLKVVGNPLLDKFYNVTNKDRMTKSVADKMRLLVVTVPIYEHGGWSKSERKKFLKKLFVKLKEDKNITFSLKIHPASENKEFYYKLLEELKISSEIFQKEDLWDIIRNFDMILSYEWSQAHTEIAYSGIKMILINIGNKIKAPLVEDGIKSGHIKECTISDNLTEIIQNFSLQKISLTEDFLKKRNELFPTLNGLSGERIANEIIRLVK